MQNFIPKWYAIIRFVCTINVHIKILLSYTLVNRAIIFG